MITVTASAWCHACPWTAGPGDWADVDCQAEKHAKVHPVGTTATPAAAIKTTAASPAAAAPPTEESA